MSVFKPSRRLSGDVHYRNRCLKLPSKNRNRYNQNKDCVYVDSIFVS